MARKGKRIKMYTSFWGTGVNLKERGNLKDLGKREQGKVRGAVVYTVMNRKVALSAGKLTGGELLAILAVNCSTE